MVEAPIVVHLKLSKQQKYQHISKNRKKTRSSGIGSGNEDKTDTPPTIFFKS